MSITCHQSDVTPETESASCLSALIRVFPSTWGRSCSPHGASVRTDPNGGKDKKLSEKKKHLSLTPSAKSSRWVPTADLLISDPFMCALRRAAAGVCAHLCFSPSGHFLLQHRGGRDGTLAEAAAAAAGPGPPVNPSLGCLCVNPAPSCGSVDITNCVAAASVRPPTSQAEKVRDVNPEHSSEWIFFFLSQLN